VRDCVAAFLDECREAIASGAVKRPEDLALPALMPALAAYVDKAARPHFRRVINASGVVVHTNLGRGLLCDSAAEAVREAALRYTNLEFDLETGRRGSRYSHVEPQLCRLCGAEAALVVNNNAAAVLLVLDTLCKGREVVVSRGELVEIGGSFRIPEVMEKSGCVLREVGTTNRTHPQDYERAVNENTAALMKVHSSNFRIIGFTAQAARVELAALARARGLPFIEDLGSGALVDFGADSSGLGAEPLASRVLADGVDVVCFSGDKVLGGPQAGIIAGKAEYIDRIRNNPLNRALRIDKLTLAALEATLRLYADPELAKKKIPTLRMVGMTGGELRRRANRLLRVFRNNLAGTGLSFSTEKGVSRVGGGAFPEMDLPTSLVLVRSAPPAPTVEVLRQRLLRTPVPVIVRVENDALHLDPRTLADDEFSLAATSLRQALSGRQF
jgi:L-seryl-tRNA(Ser) seleniumtransferase